MNFTPPPAAQPLRWLLAWLFATALITGVAGCGEEVIIPAADSFNLPPILQPILDGDVKVHELRIQKGKFTFLPGTEADTFGINGDFLGPVVRVKRGDKVRMNVTNALDETTTLHWHGLHIPAKVDGGPHQPILAGDTWSPEFTIDNRAGLYWFHPHLEGVTGRQVYMGAAGLMIIDDDEEAKLDLPRTYGVDDFPLIIQDRRFTADGQLDYLTGIFDSEGMLGPNVLVNGRKTPPLEVPAQVVRLRVLNASNARPYALGLPDDRTFHVIGSDGGLLPQAEKVTRIEIWPGERYELLLDFSTLAGKTLDLLSYSAEIDPDFVFRDALDSSTYTLLTFIVTAPTAKPVVTIPATLSKIDRIPESSAKKTRSFRLEMMTGSVMVINGNTMKMSRIDEVVTLGDTEIWAILNRSERTHPLHIHDIQFQVLSRSLGSARPHETARPHESGWKDTVSIRQGETVRVIATFEDFADPDVPYMYHCHILEHEDRGMMGQFTVVKK